MSPAAHLAPLSPEEHRVMVGWLASVAASVVDVFERTLPGDPRPRRAVDAAVRFAEGHPGTGAARSSADGAHQAAQRVAEGPSRWAARACAHAASAVSVPAHAGAVVFYARRVDPTAAHDLESLPRHLIPYCDPHGVDAPGSGGSSRRSR